MTATETATETSAKPQAKEGREANGRFAPGNPGGPGNPYARQVAEYKKATLAVVSIERLKRILDAIAKKAEDGDVAAAKLILQYTLGKPTTSVDPDRLDVDEWQKLQELSRPPREMNAVMNGVPADMASRLTNIAWQCSLETNFVQPFREGLKKMDERDAKRATAAAKKKAAAAAAPKPNGENGRVVELAAPKPNGENGRVVDAEPMANDSNGDYPDWWEQAVQEEMEKIRREEGWSAPKGNEANGAAAPKENGENRAPSTAGLAPIPNLDGEDVEWLRRIAREMLGEEPSPNAVNGSTGREQQR